MKICLVCSVGGHLNEMLALKPLYERHDHFYMTFYSPMVGTFTKHNKVYIISNASRGVFNVIVNFFQSLYVLLKEKPSVIISTGAGVAGPTMLLGKCLGKKVVYVESACRIKDLSSTGKAARFLTDLMIAQSKKVSDRYGLKYACLLDLVIAERV